MSRHNLLHLGKFSFIFLMFLIISIMPMAHGLTSNDYTFEVSEDTAYNISMLVLQHMNIRYTCPEENNYAAIEKQLVTYNPMLSSRLSSVDIMAVEEQCTESGSYHFTGIGPEPEIKECFEHLDKLARENQMYERNNRNYANNVRWVYKECYTRHYFEQRFNSKTVDNYSQEDIDKLYAERDAQFLDFLNYRIEYPQGTGPGKNYYENGTEIPPKPEPPRPSEEEIKAHPEIYDQNPAIIETVNIPSKSTITVIKEKISAFFEWFK